MAFSSTTRRFSTVWLSRFTALFSRVCLVPLASRAEKGSNPCKKTTSSSGTSSRYIREFFFAFMAITHFNGFHRQSALCRERSYFWGWAALSSAVQKF